jgi:hypothetical protein
MEMNFPHTDSAREGASIMHDLNVLLASAISRQGNSETARAVILAMRQSDDAVQYRSDMLAARIHYFAGHSQPFINEAAPFGAFLETNEMDNGEKANYDRPVYQDASMIGKDRVVETARSEIQTACVGQEN